VENEPRKSHSGTEHITPPSLEEDMRLLAPGRDQERELERIRPDKNQSISPAINLYIQIHQFDEQLRDTNHGEGERQQ
jgi:hypothetical protein